ncbi:MAG TPA: hypothetical protein VN632_07820 [Stellaceae bacterium]|nr:hypothetical protein [Stellaceae bacterium]
MTEGTTMERDDGGSIARVIYALYLAGLVVGITPIIGLIMAYIYRDGAPHWLRTHYHYQIRTFWIGLLYVFVGAITLFIFIGYFILLFWFFWYVIRCVKGLKLAGEGSAVPNAATWLF